MTETQIIFADKLHELANLIEAGEVEVSSIEEQPFYSRATYADFVCKSLINTTLTITYLPYKKLEKPKKSQAEIYEKLYSEFWEREKYGYAFEKYADCIIASNIYASANTVRVWREQWEK